MNDNRQFLKSTTLQLECISPVHIGSGEELSKNQYVLVLKEQKLYYVDEQKMAKLLYEKGLFEKFITFTENQLSKKENNKTELSAWLKENKIDVKEVALDYESICNLSKVNTVHCLVRDACGVPFIPGSSIKGVIRTAILYFLLKNKEDIRKKTWEKIKKVNLSKEEADKILKELEINLLHQELFVHEVNGKKECDRSNAVNSVMRGLIIGDAYPVQDSNCEVKEETEIAKKLRLALAGVDSLSVQQDNFIKTEIIQKIDRLIDINSHTKKKDSLMPLYREALPKGTKLEFVLTIDQKILTKIGIKNIDDIIKRLSEWHKFVINLENKKEYIKNEKVMEDAFKEAEKANIRIGAGTGFLTKSLLYALAPNENEAKEKAKEYLHLSFEKHKHRQKSNVIAPHVLKMCSNNNEQNKQIMGLCKIKKLEMKR